MPLVVNEKPGALTPWACINQLLAPDERFAIKSAERLQYLLAPKHASQLAAVFYLLNQQNIAFDLQGNGPDSSCLVIVSGRAFTQLQIHDQNVIEAGAGISLADVHQFLLDLKLEASMEEDPLGSLKQSIGELLLSGRMSGFCLRQESFCDSLLGVELVTLEGSQVKWGGRHQGGTAGPALHRLLPGFRSFPGMIVKLFLKAYPVPQSRLELSWSFGDKPSLWRHFHQLKGFSASWECLDCILSGNEGDKGFIYAQISGLAEEMEAFSRECPGYLAAMQTGERGQMKKFLQRQPLNAYVSTGEQLLMPGEYLWIQHVGRKAWRLTSRDVELEEEECDEWKDRLLRSLNG